MRVHTMVGGSGWRIGGGGLEGVGGGDWRRRLEEVWNGDWRRSEAETETVTVSGTVRRLEKLQ